MAYTKEQLDRIFSRTDGKCQICGKKLARGNYGNPDAKGSWEVDHSVPQSRGGSDHGNNLFAACTSCNRSKGDDSTRAARSKHGRTRAPLSSARKARIRKENAVALGGLGVIVGLMAGPAVAVVLGLAGAKLGHGIDPEG